MKIVLVDDERMIVSGLSRIIGRQYPEHQVLCFTNPLQALESLEKDLPDLLITDIKMPEMSGLDLIARFKDLGLSHYAVLTGLDDVPLLQESIRLRVSDYLIKPVNKEELFSLIDRVGQEQAERDRAEASLLETRFRNASGTDAEIAAELVHRLRYSDCPPRTLDLFLRAVEKDLPFWEVCFLAEELTESADPAALVEKIRGLPVIHTAVSREVRHIISYIRDHYAESISLSDAAAEVFLQPNYLTTLFGKETGLSFVQYLNRFRMEEACRKILMNPGQTITEAGQECGFPSGRYFFTLFRKYTGITPGEFRERMVRAGFSRP